MSGSGFFSIGLSRLIRYFYGGFLIIIIFLLFKAKETYEIITDLPAEISLIATLVIGALIYVAHRSIITPIHHLCLILLFKLRPLFGYNMTEPSPDPTGFFRENYQLKLIKSMRAYTALRRSDFFPHRENLDIAHAENGLLVMTATGMIIVAVLSVCHQTEFGTWVHYIVLGAILMIVSMIPDWAEHVGECRYMRANKDDIRKHLIKAGIIDGLMTKSVLIFGSNGEKKMKFEQLMKFIEEFIQTNKSVFKNMPYKISENYKPKENWNDKIPLADNHGLYFYLDLDENILLIGKAEKSRLGNRVCSHLEKGIQEQDKMFENHQWIDDKEVAQEVKEGIGKGLFYIRCMSINSEYYIAPLESFSQAYHKAVTGDLPPLNKRIG
ncbi:MAG: hypothetical protein V3W18_12205 [candidate division Zixibacteria bacterium]